MRNEQYLDVDCCWLMIFQKCPVWMKSSIPWCGYFQGHKRTRNEQYLDVDVLLSRSHNIIFQKSPARMKSWIPWCWYPSLGLSTLFVEKSSAHAQGAIPWCWCPSLGQSKLVFKKVQRACARSTTFMLMSFSRSLLAVSRTRRAFSASSSLALRRASWTCSSTTSCIRLNTPHLLVN